MFQRDLKNSFGCLMTLPAAAIGFAGLTDGIGPTGWRGLSELLGWFVTCLAMAGFIGSALRRARAGQTRFAAGGASIAAGAAAYELVSWLGLSAPWTAKVIFTSGMQVIGTVGMIAASLWLVRCIWTLWQS